MKNLIQTLKERGFVEQLSDVELSKICEKPLSFYVGFDPTGDSLHIGHLVGIISMVWFQKFGHHPIAIMGGATGRIGDPSGRTLERPLLDDENIQHNVFSIRTFLEDLFLKNNLKADIQILNNNDWFKNISFIDFMRDVGKHFRMGTMLAKDSVRSRLQSEEGMSFTEFSYQALQAYDFCHLSNEYGVTMQLGGSDQWGNITAGIELGRKMGIKAPMYGMTFPLLTRSDGKKFGKSEGGAVWLSKDKCSPYQFYQYLVQIADSDVIRLMKMLTFIDIEEINGFEESMKAAGYVPNTVQKRLAEEVTRFVHGEEGLQAALNVTKGAAPGKDAALDVATIEAIKGDMPHKKLDRKAVVGQKVTDLMTECGLTQSKSEATRLVKNGGVYLNNAKLEDPMMLIKETDLIEGRFLLLGKGKKKKYLIEV